MYETSVVRSKLADWPRLLSRAWPIDLSLVFVAVAAVLTESVVMCFHFIFLLLVVAALTLDFRPFVIRMTIGMCVSSALVIWGVMSLDMPREELEELPIMAGVLVLVFLVARSRRTAAADSEAAHAELNSRTDAELVELRRVLHQSQRLDLLGRSSVALAHDLRNVFVVVRACADDLDATGEPESVAGAREIEQATDRGLLIIDELLWIGSDRRHTREVAGLRSAITNLTPILRRLTHRGVELVLDVPPALEPVPVDKVAVTQILMNLVSNADDAISPQQGRINVVIRLEQYEGRGGVVSISVSDDGSGITEEALEHAFDTEFTTKGVGHTGLGLPTVWQIADQFGGSVDLSRRSPHGTTVTVSLPLTSVGTLTLADRDDDLDRSSTAIEERLSGAPTEALLAD